MGKKITKIAHSPWDFVTLPEKDRATAMGNIHKNLVKIACVVPEISSRTDRHIHTGIHIQTYSSQYYSTVK